MLIIFRHAWRIQIDERAGRSVADHTSIFAVILDDLDGVLYALAGDALALEDVRRDDIGGQLGAPVLLEKLLKNARLHDRLAPSCDVRTFFLGRDQLFTQLSQSVLKNETVGFNRHLFNWSGYRRFVRTQP